MYSMLIIFGWAAAKPSPPVQLRQPKAVLQQHCQHSAWGPPKFEKATPGGERMANAGIRYSVAIALPREAKGGKKQKGLHQRSFQLAEHEDGWETINDAQNAVATRVLYEVTRQCLHLRIFGTSQRHTAPASCSHMENHTDVVRHP